MKEIGWNIWIKTKPTIFTKGNKEFEDMVIEIYDELSYPIEVKLEKQLEE